MSSQASITTESLDTVTAYISLGSNLPSKFGEPKATVLAAIERLAAFAQATPLASSLYSTEPVACPLGTPDFVNAAVLLVVSVSLSAESLLLALLDIEKQFGRQPASIRNSARCLDLDLISYENQIVNDEFLILPHPRATQRRFVLQPLAEIAPNLVLPGQSHTVTQLLDQLANPNVA
ncbi:MAG: 2-amino-4-hydroxy-6-hydroxymethyldihydropteridine diphosphokinase [SAR86 cluster bacterium]|uniref:2-amino-4-hydroxy-6-hydroxymethyldihydropteridine pyrophosphokinase n=1 Tax=SAR86 cluster bacterium TaxID=2030880 RepID=A0A2A5B3I9_9GAMM|nr:MAG: 2-amino-4-hydroxy-6-hydroxymethyldihydropteridine diphosphokinase [SAR86 cluster bacterium]